MESQQDQIARLIQEEISIVPWDPQWPTLFQLEKEYLLQCLPPDVVRRIEHFGSTAIPGLPAKPIIDILVEVSDLQAVQEQVVPILIDQGYEYLWRPTNGDDGPPFYAWFIKRNDTGQRTHHIHMVEAHFHEHWERLLFRDYLLSRQELAREYAQLKQQLAQTATNRVDYTQGKSEFIKRVTAEAKNHFSKSQ
jgi:GrpB-like predicted nucleotidyltransferase (UPF0157 family)